MGMVAFLEERNSLTAEFFEKIGVTDILEVDFGKFRMV